VKRLDILHSGTCATKDGVHRSRSTLVPSLYPQDVNLCTYFRFCRYILVLPRSCHSRTRGVRCSGAQATPLCIWCRVSAFGGQELPPLQHLTSPEPNLPPIFNPSHCFFRNHTEAGDSRDTLIDTTTPAGIARFTPPELPKIFKTHACGNQRNTRSMGPI